MSFTKQIIVHWNGLNTALDSTGSREQFYTERDAVLTPLVESGKIDSYWGEIAPIGVGGFTDVLIKRLADTEETATNYVTFLVDLTNKYNVSGNLVSYEVVDYAG